MWTKKTMDEWLAEEIPKTELLIVNLHGWHRAMLFITGCLNNVCEDFFFRKTNNA